MKQIIQVTIKQPGTELPGKVLHPYALWHNQKTGTLTIRDEHGYSERFPIDSVLEIKLLLDALPFAQEQAP